MALSTFQYVTYIRTSPEKLWNALITPSFISKYWFGMSIQSDWTPGSEWKITSEEGLMDSGEVLESVSRKLLVIKWLNEWKPELKAEGYSRCVFAIEAMGGATKLTVTHSIDRANSQFIRAVSDGWPMILCNLKSLLETDHVAIAEHPGHGE